MPPTLRKFLGLTSAERRLLLRAALLLWAIRMGLLVLRFQILHRLLASVTGPRAEVPTSSVFSPGRIARLVSVASRYVPGNCLSQALAVQVLLARGGHPASLHISVSRSYARQLEAHAWVESRGRVIIGGSGAPSRYTPLPAMEAMSGPTAKTL
jgi:hypothetical protein